MTYEELLISIDLNGYENVLPSICKKCLCSKHWFVVYDDGDCHIFDRYGNEDDIKKVKEIYEDIIPKNIKKIVIPNNVMSIYSYSFYNCSSLVSVTILNTVTRIGYMAFDSCSSLTNVIIPNSVTHIGYGTFHCCSNLKSLIFKDKTFKQIKSMENYPFGIGDESIIKCN